MPRKKADQLDPALEPETNDAGEAGGVFDEAPQSEEFEEFAESLFSEAAHQVGEELQNSFTPEREAEERSEDDAEPSEEAFPETFSQEDIFPEASTGSAGENIPENRYADTEEDADFSVSDFIPRADAAALTVPDFSVQPVESGPVPPDFSAPEESSDPAAADNADEIPAPSLAPRAPRSLRLNSLESFFQTDFRRDRELTDEEQREWNAIYASFRSRSILTGRVVGVDQNELPVKNEAGQTETRTISSLVVIAYRVKVLIPENAVWMQGEERATFIMRGMIGAAVDYVITGVDREGEVAVASRSLALTKRRRAFSTGRNIVRPGDIVPCSVLVTGPRRCLITCGGYDLPMRPSDMSYTAMLDMREVYHPGQELKARVTAHNPGEQKLALSVKEASPNPFDGAERRHPVGSRRQAVISGKYAGGVFCTLPDDTVCLCLYSNAEFLLGDSVVIYIAQYNYGRRHIYGRIVSKW